MRSTTRNTLLVTTLTLLVFAAVFAAFLAGAYPRTRDAVLRAAGTRGGSVLSDLRDDETLARAKAKTLQILEVRDSRLTPDDQIRLLSLWHELGIWENMWFLGIRIRKNPMDLWMMQEIIREVEPDFIIEAGTDHGGSALYWAASLDLLGLEESRVITIDIEDRTESVSTRRLWQKYVEFIHSSSTDPETVDAIARQVEGKSVIVVLDSNHAAYHVLDELRMYGPLVSPGSYLVVEDTNIDGVPVAPEAGPGPMTALLEYMATGGDELFEVDVTREVYVLTFNPGGWLRRRTE